MNFTLLLLIISGLGYLAAFILHLFSFRESSGLRHRPGFTLMRFGFFLSTFYFAAQAVQAGTFLPIAGLREALAFFAWSLGFVYLVLMARVQSDSFGVILTPLLLLFTFAAGFSPEASGPRPEIVEGPVFAAHILSAFFAYACFTISFAAGILYLIQNHELKVKRAGTFYHKLPSLEELDKLMFTPMIWGASLLLCAVLLGFFWSKAAFGEFWLWDPKTIASSLTGAAYFVIIYMRYAKSLSSKKGAALSLAAFALVLFSFVGTRFIQGSHNYLQ